MSASVDWHELRCAKCRALLGKVERDALKAGKLIEIKCPKCNAFLTAMGDESNSQTAA